MKIHLKFCDQDKHGAGCSCGLCNSNGKSYGVGAYKIGAGEDSDPLWVEYACSETSAMSNALLRAKSEGLTVPWYQLPEKNG